MTVKELKEWINEIPEEYDDESVGICSYSIEGGPETFYSYDIESYKGYGTYYIEIYEKEI